MTTENVTIERFAEVVNIEDTTYMTAGGERMESTAITFRVEGIADTVTIWWAKDQPIPSIRAKYVLTLTPKDDAS